MIEDREARKPRKRLELPVLPLREIVVFIHGYRVFVGGVYR